MERERSDEDNKSQKNKNPTVLLIGWLLYVHDSFNNTQSSSRRRTFSRKNRDDRSIITTTTTRTLATSQSKRILEIPHQQRGKDQRECDPHNDLY